MIKFTVYIHVWSTLSIHMSTSIGYIYIYICVCVVCLGYAWCTQITGTSIHEMSGLFLCRVYLV